jgi:hypothetical protein
MYQASVLQALSDAVHASTSQTASTATDNDTVASSAYTTETTLAAMKVLEALLYRLTPQPPLSLFPGAPTSNTHTPRATSTSASNTGAKTAQHNDTTDSHTADENKEQQQQQQSDDDTVMKEQPQQSGASSCSDSVDHAVVIACIEQLLPKLYTILQCDTGTVVTCTKDTVHRVGAGRLQAARLIQVMVQLDWSEVDSVVVQCSAMNQLLELFFKHEHCSLLHQVRTILLHTLLP